MSQLKDLVVTGKSRFIGTVYADDIVGNVRGIASEATLALKDIRSQQIDTTYIKGMSINDRLVTLTKGDNSTVELYLPDPTGLIDIGTASKAGLTKLYTSTGNNTDGSITQRDLTTLFNNKLDTTATAVKAVADNAGQQIDSTYIKDSSVSGRTITFTKGNGDTFSFQTQDTTYEQATTATLGLVKLYTSSGENTDGSMTQKATGEAIEYALAYGEAALATRARKDINGKDIDSYGASLSVNGRDVSLIDSVGSTISTIQTQDTTYTQATNAALGLVKIQATTGASTTDVMTQKAVSDALDGKLDINATAQAAIKDTEDHNITDYIYDAEVDDRVITFTRGDGSTFSESVGVQATDSTLGVIKIQATTGASTADAMTQKAITDELNTKIQDVTADTTDDTRKLTFTKGDGSTFERDLSYSQATSSTLGLVKIQSSTGASTTDVMTQKAVSDVVNDKYNNVTMTKSGATRKLTFTKGDGSTAEFDLSYDQATTSTLGLVKLSGSTGASTTDVMTQKATSDALTTLKSDLEEEIGRIFTAVIVESYDDLPEIGDSKYLYLVPTGETGANLYDEYIWVVDDEQTGEGHYELFGVSAIDLEAYYTSAETDATITTATNDDVVNLTANQTTVIFTKKDGSTGSFQTKDTTYTDYTVATGSTNGVSGLVPAPTQGQQDYILTGGNKWVAKAPNAVNADSATYATNSGTAVHASTADYTSNAGTAIYATNAGTATEATHAVNADTATYATNSGTATYATNSGTAVSATKDSAGQNINTTYIKDSSVNGKVITFTKGNGDTFSITTQDTNTTYTNFTAPTSEAAGNAGLVPAPAAGQQDYILTGSGWKINTGTVSYAINAGTAIEANHAATATNADSAVYATNAGTATHASTADYSTNAGTANYSTYDSAGQKIDTTYIKGLSVSGRTITYTKGDGTTSSFQTQDNNTTYANFTPATTAADGAAGLIPKPTKSQVNYFLTGGGWATNVGTALYATNSGTATHASTADYSTNAGSATKAGTANYSTYDSAGNNINTTYIKDASVVGKVVTFTKGDNSTFNITTQDTNTTYSAFTAPTGSVAGSAGLVPAPAKNTMNYILTASGWSNTASAAYATSASTATHANDAVTTASVSGRTITFTKGDASTFNITTQDNNTTYTLSNDGATIKLNPSSGSATTVSLNDLINGLSSGTAAPGDNDYFISQFAGGGTTTTTYHRRPVSALFNYMKGKFGTAAQKNVATSGNASTAEVVMGNDTRLTDSRNAKDVYSWAKAATKPSYSASEVGAIDATLKGAANGVAELDANGLVPSSQLPAYVDDVLEYATYADFPSEGTSGKIYVDLSTNLTYRWGGSAYVEISPSLALGETSSTAYRGDYGKTAYTHATDPNRLTTAKTSGFYKFAATSYGHVKSVTTVTKADITALGIPEADTHFVTHMYAGTGTANNASSTNGNTKLTIVDDTTVRDNITLTGSGGTTITSNASGTITVNSKNSMSGAYTPNGECTGGAVTLNTTEVPNITGVGTLPTCTFPTVSLSVNNNKELSITHTGGSFSQGTLPTTGTKITVATSVKTFTQPTFNGTASTVSVS